jgi:hypothetical protein
VSLYSTFAPVGQLYSEPKGFSKNNIDRTNCTAISISGSHASRCRLPAKSNNCVQSSSSYPQQHNMRATGSLLVAIFVLPLAVSTFAPIRPLVAIASNQSPQQQQLWRKSKTAASAVESSDSGDNEDEPKLLLTGDEINQQMARLRSKYPTSEADYLAAARARNAAKVASSERTATDSDWQQIAAEKLQAVGEIDDWEQSKAEAGNMDSQILIPIMESTTGEDGEEEEPKLLLF